MCKILLSLVAAATLAGGAVYAAPRPADALFQPAQYYGSGPFAADWHGRGWQEREWREREWRHEQWLRHRRWEERRRWEAYHGW